MKNFKIIFGTPTKKFNANSDMVLNVHDFLEAMEVLKSSYDEEDLKKIIGFEIIN